MPRLRAFAGGAAVGELSVRATASATRCADGLATLSAGNRAAAGSACTLTTQQLAAARRHARDNRFAAHVGALGTALHAAHVTTAAVGAAAVPVVADEQGDAGVVVGDVAQAVTAADVVAVVDAGLYGAPAAQRRAAARATDQLLRAQLGQVPPTATVIVAGVSDGEGSGPDLHPVLVSGPAWRHRELRSGSTGRTPYVQLIDLAPTVLAAVDVRVPSVMAGRPVRPTAARVASIAHYADDDRHARRAAAVAGDTTRGLAVAVIVVVAAVVIGARRRPLATFARVLSALVVAVPVATFVIQVAPWWRRPTASYAGLLAAAAVAGGVLLAHAARRGAAPVLLAGAGLTAAVLVADQLAGSPLQLSAPLGDNPLVAGRFHGLGNVAFAVVSAALLLVAGVGAGVLNRSSRPRAAVLLAGGVAALAVVVDAAPMLGDDFGGLLALVPASAVLVALVAGRRLSARRVATYVAVAVAVAVVVALADYARPAVDQTHIGRFVGQVLHGGAARVVRRKADASLGSVRDSAVTWLVGVCVVVGVVGRRGLRARLEAVPGLTAAVAAAVVLAVIGSVVNDSGIAVAAGVLFVVVPVVGASGVLTRDVASGRPRASGEHGDGEHDHAHAGR
jgi:hypothetical protein